MNSPLRPVLLALAMGLITPGCLAAPAAVPPAVPATFEPGQTAPYLGVFTHVESSMDMPEKLVSLKSLIAGNPHISGITLKIQWKHFHPTRSRIDWDGLEALVATAAQAGKLVNLVLIPGAAAPDWIYENGAKKAGPFEFKRGSMFVPVPWDEGFMALFLADLKALATRYADDPRIFQVEVLGHHYNPNGEEMHAPPAAAFESFGWSEETVLANWRYWIDRYAELFPKKKLSLIVSQMYRGVAPGLPRQVTAYFMEKCAGRAVLQTHQLQGRQDALAESGQICAEFARLAPNSHEMVGSFKEQAERQGTAAMSVYYAKRAGNNTLYLQLWRRDCDDPQYAKALAEAWEKYGALNAAEMKGRLIADHLYIEKSTWRENSTGIRSTPPPPAKKP